MNYLNLELYGIDQNGNSKLFKLQDFIGNNVVLYFYPQDDTPVCTQEALDFQEFLDTFPKSTVIIGVSADSTESHLEFQNKHKLNFILLADPKNELKNEFENTNKYITNLHRGTFVLDKTGKIVKFWDKVDIDGHVKEVAEFVKTLQ